MDSSIIVAALGFLGTILGSGLGVIASSKLTNYRIEQLEKKVDKHNGVIERVYKLEEALAVHEEEYHNLEEKVNQMKW